MFSGISCVAYAISHPSYSVLRPNPQQNPPLQDAILISNRSLQNALSKTRWANSSRPLPNRMPIPMLTTHWFSTCQTSLNYKSFTTSLPFHREIARIHRFVARTSSPIMKWNFQDGCFPGFCIRFWVCANDVWTPHLRLCPPGKWFGWTGRHEPCCGDRKTGAAKLSWEKTTYYTKKNMKYIHKYTFR